MFLVLVPVSDFNLIAAVFIVQLISINTPLPELIIH